MYSILMIDQNLFELLPRLFGVYPIGSKHIEKSPVFSHLEPSCVFFDALLNDDFFLLKTLDLASVPVKALSVKSDFHFLQDSFVHKCSLFVFSLDHMLPLGHPVFELCFISLEQHLFEPLVSNPGISSLFHLVLLSSSPDVVLKSSRFTFHFHVHHHLLLPLFLCPLALHSLERVPKLIVVHLYDLQLYLFEQRFFVTGGNLFPMVEILREQFAKRIDQAKFNSPLLCSQLLFSFDFLIALRNFFNRLQFFIFFFVYFCEFFFFGV